MRVPLDLCRPVLVYEASFCWLYGLTHAAQAIAGFLNKMTASSHQPGGVAYRCRGYIRIHVAHDTARGPLGDTAPRATHRNVVDASWIATTATFSRFNQPKVAAFDSIGPAVWAM